MPTEPRPLPDESERRQAVQERTRNVLVDAGAGTGKTTLVIDRVVEMVAPTDVRATPAPLDRLAVITFTRRAAGELRYRLRQKLLEALRDAGTEEPRATRLRLALGAVDTAYIGTIHSFADRLLRLRPVEAGISPRDRKSTRLNSSHITISYAVYCLKKKKTHVKEMLGLPNRSTRLASALEVTGWVVPVVLERRGVNYLDPTEISAGTGTALFSRRQP